MSENRVGVASSDVNYLNLVEVENARLQEREARIFALKEPNQMKKTVSLDLPDVATRSRQNVIRSVLNDLVSHLITMEEAVKSIDHLTIAATNMQKREFNGGDTPPIP